MNESVSPNEATKKNAVTLAVVVAALGYFVDIYDLILFAIIRVPSLRDIGVAEGSLMSEGALILNMQMGGMLIGGLLWGILGDRRGRLSVLFGSIIMYSLGNIANGLVHSTTAYAIVRLVAGIGLAGELGAGITLVSEVMRKESRGYGTAIVASVGICGALVAAVVGEMTHWRTAYFIGGGLGIGLLALRVGVLESGMWSHTKQKSVSRGNFLMLFHTRSRIRRYVGVILVGIPVWYVIGVLITFCPEIGQSLGMVEAPKSSRAVFFCYAGLALGGIASGFAGQWMHSRKKSLGASLVATVVFVAGYFLIGPMSLTWFYTMCIGLGIATGYWAVFVTVASEQFGTNIRATATTTAPNFVRGAVVPMTSAFVWCKGPLGVWGSALLVGCVTITMAFIALRGIEETYGRDLDFLEE